jgi:hypothetical protein
VIATRRTSRWIPRGVDQLSVEDFLEDHDGRGDYGGLEA